MIKIIHYYPRAFIGNGGVTTAMWRFVKSVKNQFDVFIAFDQNLVKEQPLAIKDIKKIPIKHYLNGRLSYPSNFLKKFDQNTVIFIHSGFLLNNIITTIYAKKIKAKVVLIPHGCYHPTILKYNSFIKKIFIQIEKFFFKHLFFIQALTKIEGEHIAKIFNKNSIKVIPVPVELKKNNKFTLNERNYFSYVGRYDIETKGIDLLIKAYKLVPEKIRIPIIMHGTNGRNTNINDIKNLVKKNGMNKYIKVYGPIYGEKKIKFLISSLMSIQLSRWDTFPLSVWESISLKVPCLISDQNASWQLIKQNKFGVVTELKISSIKNKLIRILSNKNKFLNLISNTNYINKNLSLRSIEKKYNDVLI